MSPCPSGALQFPASPGRPSRRVSRPPGPRGGSAWLVPVDFPSTIPRSTLRDRTAQCSRAAVSWGRILCRDVLFANFVAMACKRSGFKSPQLHPIKAAGRSAVSAARVTERDLGGGGETGLGRLREAATRDHGDDAGAQFHCDRSDAVATRGSQGFHKQCTKAGLQQAESVLSTSRRAFGAINGSRTLR
jgi:hypothetical protein